MLSQILNGDYQSTSAFYIFQFTSKYPDKSLRERADAETKRARARAREMQETERGTSY